MEELDFKYVSQYESVNIVLSEKFCTYDIKVLNSITSNSYLAYLAIKSLDKNIRYIAISKITSQLMLYAIIIKSRNEKDKLNALSKLTDENLIASVVIHEENETVGIEALKILGQLKFITALAHHGISEQLRLKALKYVENEQELKKIALCEHQYSSVRKMAKEKIKNINILMEINQLEKTLN
ncbi:MAG: hypothetical protein IJ809_01120 [Clostridia bacterium]|nr:hypothetical protein [Clostridia bacterium]